MADAAIQAERVEIWSVALTAPRDIASARRAATEGMEAIGASVIKRTKFVTAVSEIARNALLHGGGGFIRFSVSRSGRAPRLLAECVDRGPGVADIERAMTDGYTTGGGLGRGLGGARRLVDCFEISSSAERGTRVLLASSAR